MGKQRQAQRLMPWSLLSAVRTPGAGRCCAHLCERSAAATTLSRGRMAAARGKTLVTFDVDGTLIRSRGEDANKLHKQAFAAAFQDVYNFQGSIDEVNCHGLTDMLVVEKVCRHKSVSDAAIEAGMQACLARMVEYALANRGDAGVGLDILPG